MDHGIDDTFALGWAARCSRSLALRGEWKAKRQVDNTILAQVHCTRETIFAGELFTA
jgi:hypothetical protein